MTSASGLPVNTRSNATSTAEVVADQRLTDLGAGRDRPSRRGSDPVLADRVRGRVEQLGASRRSPVHPQSDSNGDHADRGGQQPTTHQPKHSPFDGRERRRRTIREHANTISEVLGNGQLRVVSYIPNETANPFRDATPTCIAQGPDGMLYVATLNLFANFAEPGKSNVWRVDPNANYPTAPTLWATGLTTATACAFDRSGNFWATEMFQPNGATAPPGDVVRIPFEHPNQLTHFGGGMLPLPGGIAQGPDGAMYVSINSADPTPGSGAIVRLGRDRDHDQDDD